MAQNDPLSEAPASSVAEPADAQLDDLAEVDAAADTDADAAAADAGRPGGRAGRGRDLEGEHPAEDGGARRSAAVQQAAALWESAVPEASVEACVEGILFVTDRPVSLNELARALDITKRAAEIAVEALAADLAERGLRIQRNDDHVQLVSAPAVAPAIQRFLGLESASRLSRAALETLSIIAYRQPITRPEIDELRGVNSDGVMRTLMARGLVDAVGRRETVGQPYEYGTTFRFLEYFGIESLDDLPPIRISAAPSEALDDVDDVGDVGDVGDVEIEAKAAEEEPEAEDGIVSEDGTESGEEADAGSDG